MTLRALLALFRRMLVADMTPPVDRAEVARAGDVHSRKVARAAVVRSWAENAMEHRRQNADRFAQEMFTRGLMGAAALGVIATMMSDGTAHVIEEVES